MIKILVMILRSMGTELTFCEQTIPCRCAFYGEFFTFTKTLRRYFNHIFCYCSGFAVPMFDLKQQGCFRLLVVGNFAYKDLKSRYTFTGDKVFSNVIIFLLFFYFHTFHFYRLIKLKPQLDVSVPRFCGFIYKFI